MSNAVVDAPPGPPSHGLRDNHALILERVSRFARGELHGLQERMDAEERWPPGTFEKIGAAGYPGATVPPELGGTGLDVFTSGLVLQAVSHWNPSVGLALLAHDNLCLDETSDLRSPRWSTERTARTCTSAAAHVLRAGLVLVRCADRARQIHGGSWYIWEMEVNRLYRACKLLQISAGTNEVRRLITARELLGS